MSDEQDRIEEEFEKCKEVPGRVDFRIPIDPNKPELLMPLDWDQRARVDALSAAREVLQSQTFVSKSPSGGVDELLRVARYIITGQDRIETDDVFQQDTIRRTAEQEK